MWDLLAMALISLIENLASSPQLLVILLLEGYRVTMSTKYGGKTLPPNSERMTRYQFWLLWWRATLNAAPSVGLTISIFFVRF